MGPDALQITVQLAGQHRTRWRATTATVFKTGNWRLVNEAKDAEGAIVLLAEQDGPPLWVRIRSGRTAGGSLVELSGAAS